MDNLQNISGSITIHSMYRVGMRWFIVAILVGASLFADPVAAETLKSNNYQLDESELGTTSNNSSSSASYGLAAALGDLAVGESASANYQTNAGSVDEQSLPRI